MTLSDALWDTILILLGLFHRISVKESISLLQVASVGGYVKIFTPVH